jgi:hypothetical protein
MTATDIDTRATEEAIEAALEAVGWPWTRRGASWIIPANAALPREIQVRRGEGSVRVEAVLVEWDAETEAVEALTQFLRGAEAGLPGVHCEIEGTVARIAVDLGHHQIDQELPRAVSAVAAALRRLSREAAALLHADAARAYLAFHRRWKNKHQ